ncbi:MAG TPA: hypothetical protein VK576_04225, partial [Thermoleophilia bacterium]|nr:hypothetical protein [Thermoleophilia bacterium]
MPMQTVLLAAAQAVALDPPYDAVFSPLVDDLIDALAGDDPAPFLTAVEGHARLLAHERSLRMVDVFSAIRLGFAGFRGALGQAPDEALVAARAERLEGEALMRAGIGFAEGLEETLVELDRAVLALSPIDDLTGVAKPDEIARQFAVELERCRRMDLALGGFVVGIDPPPRSTRSARAEIDELLRRIAQLLRDSLRRYDAVGRCADLELLAVLPDATRRGIRSVV